MSESEKLPIHPQYSVHHSFYERIRDVISPLTEKSLINPKYVKPYVTEAAADTPKEVYNNRLARTYAITFSDSIIDEHVGTLSQKVTVAGFGRGDGDTESTILDDIVDDFDGCGNDITEFAAQLLEVYIAYGFCGLLITGEQERAASAEQQRQLRQRSFGFIYQPFDILNWSRFRTGQYIGELQTVTIIDSITKKGALIRVYTYEPEINGYSYQMYLAKDITSRDSFLREEISVVPEGDRVEHANVPYLPFFIFGRGPKDSFVGKVSSLDVALVNRLSTYSNVNFAQGFRQIIFSGVQNVKDFLKRVHEQIVGAVSSEIAVHQIPAGDPVALEKEIKMIMHWARRVGMFQMRQLTDDMTAQVASAESKAKDLQTLEQIYDSTLKMFEKHLSKVFRLIYYIETTTPTQEAMDAINVSIARDFDLSDTQFDIERDKFILFVAANLESSVRVEVEKEVLKRYVSKMRLVPTNELNEDQLMQRLMEQIQNAKPAGGLSFEPSNLFGAPTTTETPALPGVVEPAATPEPEVFTDTEQ